MAGCQEMQGILFFIPTLEPGGAERVCLHFANNLRSRRRVILLQERRGMLLQSVGPGVSVLEMLPKARAAEGKTGSGRGEGRLGIMVRERIRVSGTLNKGAGWWESRSGKWPRRVRAARRFCSLFAQARRLAVMARQHDCAAVTSFITVPNIVATLAKTFFDRRLKVIINVHDMTGRILEESGLDRPARFLLKWLVGKLYPKADLIVAVTRGIKDDLVDRFRIPEARIVVINNPIDVGQVRARAGEMVDHQWFREGEGPIVLAVGRLVRLKGYDFLIRAFARIPSEHKARLVILGEGPERPRLERLIEDHGLKERVALLGFQENPWKYMARADMLVLSSLTEGLPNVIGEAMALDLPVLATDCSPGVREYLHDGENGVLVPAGNVAALAQGVERLICDRQLRTEMVKRSRARLEVYDLARIVRAYEDALARVISG